MSRPSFGSVSPEITSPMDGESAGNLGMIMAMMNRGSDGQPVNKPVKEEEVDKDEEKKEEKKDDKRMSTLEKSKETKRILNEKYATLRSQLEEGAAYTPGGKVRKKLASNGMSEVNLETCAQDSPANTTTSSFQVEASKESSLQFDTSSSQEGIDSQSKAGIKVPTKKTVQKLKEKLKARSNRQKDEGDENELISPTAESPPILSTSPATPSHSNSLPPLIRKLGNKRNLAKTDSMEDHETGANITITLNPNTNNQISPNALQVSTSNIGSSNSLLSPISPSTPNPFFGPPSINSSRPTATPPLPSGRRGRSLSSTGNIDRPRVVADQPAQDKATTESKAQSANPAKLIANQPISNINAGNINRAVLGKHRVEINQEDLILQVDTPATAYRSPIEISKNEDLGSEGLMKKIRSANSKATESYDDDFKQLSFLERKFDQLSNSLDSLIASTEQSLQTVLNCYAPINEESSEIRSTLINLKEGQERLTKEMAQVHEILQAEALMVDQGFEQFNELAQAFRQTMILSSKSSKIKEIFWIVLSWILAFIASIIWVAILVTRLVKGYLPSFLLKPVQYLGLSSAVNQDSTSPSSTLSPSASSPPPGLTIQNRPFDISTNPEVWRRKLRAYFDDRAQTAQDDS